jgi:outer membrane protein OmpA-like peptidoglycan-associated protein
MATITDSHSALSTTRVAQRRWVRRDSPVWPFVWRGLLPLLGLLLVAIYALGPFARGAIESRVLRETRAALDAGGFGWAAVSVSGQQVSLSGVQPASGAGDAALAAARAATCPTWIGRRICAVEVSGKFSEPAPKHVAAPAPALAPAVVQPTQSAQACEQKLAAIVSQSKIEFATGSAAIQPHSAEVLDALAKAARDCPGVIRVEGHTDSIGVASANLALSEARAAAVRQALIARDIPQARLQAQGYGAERPLAENKSAAGRAQNRRIEFRVVSGN